MYGYRVCSFACAANVDAVLVLLEVSALRVVVGFTTVAVGEGVGVGVGVGVEVVDPLLVVVVVDVKLDAAPRSQPENRSPMQRRMHK